jgi:hypothetical protein
MQKGATTRLVDRYIQDFFNKGICFIYEDRYSENTEEKTKQCFDLFVKRMKSEHEQVLYSFEFTEADRINCYKVVKDDKNCSNT